MRDLFLTILELTFAAGCLVPLVLLLRLALGKAPKFIVCILWGMVALRLLLPVTLESAVSLNPGKETFAKLEKEFLIRETPPVEDVPLQPNLPQETPDLPQASPEIPQATPTETAVDWVAILAWIWFAGVCAMGAHGAISYLRLRRKVQVCLQVEKRVYLCDEIGTPFLLGLFRPCIYLPSSMEECHRASVLSHEQAHIRRGDHIWKPLGFVLLVIHWFNPLLWVAYFFLCRDIETACDEKVVRGMDDAHKASYSHALVACSLQGDSHRGWISACPIAFGEVGVKSRVKGVLSYKKPAFWVLVAAILACVAVAVFFLTDPLSAKQDANNSTPHTSQESAPSAEEESAENSDSAGPILQEQGISYLVWQVEGDRPVEEMTLPEYPGLIFRWEAPEDGTYIGSILVCEDQEARKGLPVGFPNHCICFADVDGDGKRELLYDTTSGSGITYEYVYVYDPDTDNSYYAGGATLGGEPWMLHPTEGGLLVMAHLIDGGYMVGSPALVTRNEKTVLAVQNAVAKSYDGSVAVAIGYTFTKKNPVDEIDRIPRITLYEDGTFSFWFGALSSYLGHGNFSLEDGQLVLNTYDGKFTYRFDIVEGTLVFREEGSSDMDWYANLYDGCVFH